MSEYATIEHYVNHVMGEITKRDVEQVSERLRALGWEEVVRCRDCVAYAPFYTNAGTKLDYGECMRHRRQTDDDRFCWWAERSDR